MEHLNKTNKDSHRHHSDCRHQIKDSVRMAVATDIHQADQTKVRSLSIKIQFVIDFSHTNLPSICRRKFHYRFTIIILTTSHKLWYPSCSSIRYFIHIPNTRRATKVLETFEFNFLLLRRLSNTKYGLQ